MKFSLLVITICSYTVIGELSTEAKRGFEIQRANMIADIITLNFKNNGWTTVLCIGSLPDEFYKIIQNISNTLAITNIERDDENSGVAVQYYANSILISLQDIDQYEATMMKLMDSPYWHPHANILIYYHQLNHKVLPKIFFSLWFYKAINSIIVQYNDSQETLQISHYSPFISGEYKLEHLYGCWTTRKIGMPIASFDKGFTCEEKCHNVSLQSDLRKSYLGTCIGFSTNTVSYNSSILKTLNLFEDVSKNLHGFTFRAHATEIKPFLIIDDNGNGSFTLRSREGLLWTNMAKLMNFNIHLTSNITIIKKPFNYELTITKIIEFAARKIDLCIMPMYLFDLMVVEIDYSFPYSDSGVCIMAHRAGYARKLFNVKSHASRSLMAKFFIGFVFIWITFSLYHWVEKKRITVDQIGKDLLNTFRNVLSIPPYKPPRHRFFRPFLTMSMWGFFAFNFASQATITSFLAALKRGKEVDSFQQIINTGYLIYGLASPDLLDTEPEDKFHTITSRIVHVQDPFDCVDHISYDSHRFCLIDCNVGRYLERNRLNEKGEQYLHIARERMHSHYLIAMLTKHSPLTERFNKYLTMFYEAGFIKKWEEYRYNDIKEEATTRPLGLTDYKSIFNLYFYFLGLTTTIFFLEIIIFHIKKTLKLYFLKRKI